MDELEARTRFAAARIAHLATVRPDGAPHVVPVIYALEGNTIWLVIDEKPKRHRRLQRLINIGEEPRVSLLVNSYEEDWNRLWWVRADGRARVVDQVPELERAVRLLLNRYPQEREHPPKGPALAVEIGRWRHWSAS